MKNSLLALHGSRRHRGQRGAILVLSLMFLIILTLIGISAMNTTTFEEKMSGSSRDWNVALAAAEAAIRDAEYDITAKTLPGYTGSARSLYRMTGFGDETDVENGTCSVSTGNLKEGLCRRTSTGGTSTVPTFSSTTLTVWSTASSPAPVRVVPATSSKALRSNRAISSLHGKRQRPSTPAAPIFTRSQRADSAPTSIPKSHCEKYSAVRNNLFRRTA